MQDLNRTSTLGTVYGPAAILSEIQKPTAKVQYAVDRLDATGRYLGDLTSAVDWTQPPEIRYDATAAVKRSVTLRMLGNPGLNALQDLIQLRFQLRVPDGGYVSFSLGIFTLLMPDRTISSGPTWRMINGADLGQLLLDDIFRSSFAVGAGSTYTTAIASIVAGYTGPTQLLAPPFGMWIPDLGKTLPSPMGWDAGESRLKAITDLLAAVNCLPPWWDDVGLLRSGPIPDYYQQLPAYTFDLTAGSSIMGTPIEERPDTSQAANIFPVQVQDPTRTDGPLAIVYENKNPLSPISTGNWHPKGAPVISDTRITDAATAASRGQTAAQESARIFDQFTVATIPWPFSQDRDLFGIIYSSADEGLVNEIYLELGWSFRCAPLDWTQHQLVRVVPA